MKESEGNTQNNKTIDSNLHLCKNNGLHKIQEISTPGEIDTITTTFPLLYQVL